MEIDLGKLGKLVEKCKECEVTDLKINDEGVHVVFGSSIATAQHTQIDDKEIQALIDATQKKNIVVETNNPENEIEEPETDFDEDMLHLTSPVEWQARQMAHERDNTIASDGTDESENDYEH